MNLIGAEFAHRATGAPCHLAALEEYFRGSIGPDGNWLRPVRDGADCMKGYSLLYLSRHSDDRRFAAAADGLAAFLLNEHPRETDGSLAYTPKDSCVLVDSLAMICPFLARYARMRDSQEAHRLCADQLEAFIAVNVDGDSRLPYHGYYADGDKRLGMHGWGRGVGWYMLALADTFSEMKDPATSSLAGSFVSAAETLKKYQRPDGHWNWAVLHKINRFDSSATSLIGYGIARGIEAGMLDESYIAVVDKAVEALMAATPAGGVVTGTSAECGGMGVYPQSYGSAPWLQGATVALAGWRLINFDIKSQA